jgi:ABC-2 type transport system permease protein
VSAAKRAAAAARGQIRDQGYQRYPGPYTNERGRWALIARRMLKMTARQPWVLVMLILSIFPALIGGVVLYIQARFQAGNASAPDSIVYEVVGGSSACLLLAFLTATFAGGGAVADDARGGAFQFYFARPVTREQYLLGKLTPPVVLVACVSLGPALLLSLLRVALARSGADALASLLLPLQTLAQGTLTALTLGVPVVALSSLSRGRGYVQGAFATAFLLPWILGTIFVQVTRSPWPALLSIPGHLHNVGRFLYGLPPDEHALPLWVSVAFLAALIGGSIALLRRRLAAVEVIAG